MVSFSVTAGILLLYVLAAYSPAAAQSSDRATGTTLSFLTSDQKDSCPGPDSAPTFHTAAPLDDRIAFCINMADIFTHRNQTNVTVNGIDIAYGVDNFGAYDSAKNYSALRYANAPADPNAGGSGPPSYWITFYTGRDCLDMAQPVGSFSCADAAGSCFQLPFNISSFTLNTYRDNGDGGCYLNAASLQSAATALSGGWVVSALLSAAAAALFMG